MIRKSRNVVTTEPRNRFQQCSAAALSIEDSFPNFTQNDSQNTMSSINNASQNSVLTQSQTRDSEGQSGGKWNKFYQYIWNNKKTPSNETSESGISGCGPKPSYSINNQNGLSMADKVMLEDISINIQKQQELLLKIVQNSDESANIATLIREFNESLQASLNQLLLATKQSQNKSNKGQITMMKETQKAVLFVKKKVIEFNKSQPNVADNVNFHFDEKLTEMSEHFEEQFAEMEQTLQRIKTEMHQNFKNSVNEINANFNQSHKNFENTVNQMNRAVQKSIDQNNRLHLRLERLLETQFANHATVAPQARPRIRIFPPKELQATKRGSSKMETRSQMRRSKQVTPLDKNTEIQTQYNDDSSESGSYVTLSYYQSTLRYAPYQTKNVAAAQVNNKSALVQPLRNAMCNKPKKQMGRSITDMF